MESYFVSPCCWFINRKYNSLLGALKVLPQWAISCFLHKNCILPNNFGLSVWFRGSEAMQSLFFRRAKQKVVNNLSRECLGCFRIVTSFSLAFGFQLPFQHKLGKCERTICVFLNFLFGKVTQVNRYQKSFFFFC